MNIKQSHTDIDLSANVEIAGDFSRPCMFNTASLRLVERNMDDNQLITYRLTPLGECIRNMPPRTPSI